MVMKQIQINKYSGYGIWTYRYGFYWQPSGRTEEM